LGIVALSNSIFLPFRAEDFGEDFAWGAATAAFQIEGAVDVDGKTPSIWDVHTAKRGKVKDKTKPHSAVEFYTRFGDDLDLLAGIGMRNFRYSVSWSRVLPNGTGVANPKGLDYYDRLTDACLARGITPWVTVYHWDMPQVLQDKGGWTNRDVLDWFSHFADVVVHRLGDRVPRWVVMNEQIAFTALGYLIGYHAPGKLGMDNFLKSIHHACLAAADGGRVLRAHLPASAEIGNAYSCFHVTPASQHLNDVMAAKTAEATFNRLFIEPSLGLGYPVRELPFLKAIEKWMKPGDDRRLKFDADFVGVQNYTRQIVKYNWFVPYVRSHVLSPRKRKIPLTEMGWEVYPEGLYHLLKFYAAYEGVKKIYITENGSAYPDVVQNGRVQDTQRIHYFENYLGQALRAKRDGVPLAGYLVWTLIDNFEWVEGFKPRFGLIHVDHTTQVRTLKDSAYWFRELLTGEPMPPKLTN
jgi:beta-glucosidase